ncbi:MAG: DNA gyrase inhibitor YacG [Mariprofundaceae bacterium]|nr:DNA gyrase inhibitor YacG [Mariprofundaceae bacterium]
MTEKFRCPTCGKPVTRQNKSFPFCSERCRLTDLGKWASGDYRIAGHDAAPWEIENSDD